MPCSPHTLGVGGVGSKLSSHAESFSHDLHSLEAVCVKCSANSLSDESHALNEASLPLLIAYSVFFD